VNNCSFVRASGDTLKQLLLVQNYVAWGSPSKKILDEVIRKRGYLKGKDMKRLPISDNVLIEELLGEQGCICIEDVIDAFWRCKQNPDLFKAVKEVIWPV